MHGDGSAGTDRPMESSRLEFARGCTHLSPRNFSFTINLPLRPFSEGIPSAAPQPAAVLQLAAAGASMERHSEKDIEKRSWSKLCVLSLEFSQARTRKTDDHNMLMALVFKLGSGLGAGT